MRQVNQSLYQKDFYKWSQVQASLLKKGELTKLDLEHIIEEIESLGKSDRRALYSQLVVLFQHLLKNTYVPEQKGNSRSWDATIFNTRKGIQKILKESPSLKKEFVKMFDEAYSEARQLAIIETNSLYMHEEKFPLECPWSLNEIL